mgnify:CR=1 FL=1
MEISGLKSQYYRQKVINFKDQKVQIAIKYQETDHRRQTNDIENLWFKQ